MKKLIILGSIILPLLYIVSKDNSINAITLPVQISGKIVNINYSPGLYVVATTMKNDSFATMQVLDSSLIDWDGSFKITLNTPPDNALDTVQLRNCAGNIHINSTEVKQTSLILIVDSLGKLKGFIQRSNFNPDSILPPYPLVSLL